MGITVLKCNGGRSKVYQFFLFQALETALKRARISNLKCSISNKDFQWPQNGLFLNYIENFFCFSFTFDVLQTVEYRPSYFDIWIDCFQGLEAIPVVYCRHGFYLIFSRHKITGSHVYIIACSLGRTWIQPWLSITLQWSSIYCLPLLPRLMWGENQPPPLSSHCLVGWVLMATSDYKFWVQTEALSALICFHTDLWLSPHHLHRSKSCLFITAGKRLSCLFQLGCPFTHSIDPLAV